MKRFSVALAVALVVLAGCAPTPPGDGEQFTEVSDQVPFATAQVFETTLEGESVYRASVTALVLGPVELCVVVNVFSGPEIAPHCETIAAVPGAQYSATFTIATTEPQGATLLLASKTAAPAFTGTLSVIQGQPLHPV